MEHLNTSGIDATFDVAADTDGIPEIRLGGELDISNVDAFRAALRPVMALDPRTIVFDLGRLSFMDSSGIAVLLEVAQRVSVVEIRQPTPVIRRIIEATGLTEILRLS